MRIQRRRVGEHAVVLEFPEGPGGPEGMERLRADLVELCDEIAFDDQVRTVAILYAGDLFAGSAQDPARYGHTGALSLANPIARLPQPVIAAIRGDAVGPGLELALACDIRIGTLAARFGFPQVPRGGIPCDGGTQRLPRLIGQAKALEMLLIGQPVDGVEAMRIGLLSRAVAPGELAAAAESMAREMANRAPHALCYAKEALRNGLDMALDQGLRMEMDLYLLLFSTHDRTEGVTAFREKRTPKFTGS